MPERDDLGGGEADAEAAAFLRPGAVGPVEPVKQPLRRTVGQGLAVVLHAQAEHLIRPRQAQGDGAALRGILDRVVKEDGKQGGELVPAAAQTQIRFDLRVQGDPAQGHRLLKGLGRLLREGGKIQLGKAARLGDLLGPGQGEQVPRQLAQARDLGGDVAGPFILPADHLHRLGIGPDDGDRRFQLVTGVGDELTLAVHVFGDRGDRLFCQENDQQEHQPPADQSGQTGQGGNAQDGGGPVGILQKDPDGLTGLCRGGGVAEVADRAGLLPGGQGLLAVGHGGLGADAGDAGDVGLDHCAVQGPDGEIDRGPPVVLGQRLGEEALPLPFLQVVFGRLTEFPFRRTVLSVGAVRASAVGFHVGQHFQNQLRLRAGGPGVDDVQRAEDQDQQDRDRDHCGSDEPLLQRPYHGTSVSV